MHKLSIVEPVVIIVHAAGRSSCNSLFYSQDASGLKFN
jgi:hypothetical protein